MEKYAKKRSSSGSSSSLGSRSLSRSPSRSRSPSPSASTRASPRSQSPTRSDKSIRQIIEEMEKTTISEQPKFTKFSSQVLKPAPLIKKQDIVSSSISELERQASEAEKTRQESKKKKFTSVPSKKTPVPKAPPKASPKKVVPTKTTEDNCEKFIELAEKTPEFEKFRNPITDREITKGSATFFKYLKECETKIKQTTLVSIKQKEETTSHRVGKRKVYRCRDYKVKNTNKFEPNPHQIIARNRFKNILNETLIRKDTPRGLLLYYGLGSGKTCTYAMLADLYHDKYPDRPIFIFTPGSLRTNFLEQYCSFCGKNENDVEKHFTFYTLNDTRIIKKLPKNFDNSLVIIDEVHKLTHAKANQSPIVSHIYDVIQQSKGMNIITGSGTPIETGLDELMYLTNLHIRNYYSDLETFKKQFVYKDEYYYEPKDKEAFEELYSSFISYYDPEKIEEESNAKAFPSVIYEDVYVPINPDRQDKYMDTILEENERMRKPDERLRITDPEKYKKQKQMYYIAISRLNSSQKSNFDYPQIDLDKLPDAIVSKKQKEETKEEETKEEGDLPQDEEEGIIVDEEVIDESVAGKGTAPMVGVGDYTIKKGGWISKDLLKDLQDRGEKLFEILDDIENHKGKHAVYTRFKTYFGSRLLGALLDLKEIPYVFFDGDMSDRDRVKVLEAFNSPNNIDGSKIKVIILTSAGSAGINLKEIRRFHILEQYFNLSYLKQVVGRGVRYLSHQRLPEHDRNITVRNYFLSLGDDMTNEAMSSDVMLRSVAQSKDRSIEKIRAILQSFDI